MTARATLPVPGLLMGNYPERPAAPSAARSRAPKQRAPRVTDVRLHETTFGALSDELLAAACQNVRRSLMREGFQPRHVASALALGCVAAQRRLGVQIFDGQIAAATIVLGNQLAEMATGEGKTCAVALAAAVAAMAGIPVHIITANDYLVTRDARLMQPLYAALGLTVGAVTQALEQDERRREYRSNVTYCTAKELVFDYLRDGQLRWAAHGRSSGAAASQPSSPAPVLRGLCMAIIDEADGILIDEARVPLVLATSVDDSHEHTCLGHALHLARGLREGSDFREDDTARACLLTTTGRLRVELDAAARDPVWFSRLHRENAIQTALTALHAFQLDRDYLVRDGEVQVIDPTTGRVAPGRSWSLGVHQAIELKEGCQPTASSESAAQITYQRFFARYWRLAGVSGTLAEARRELHAVYGLAVKRVPLRRASRRKIGPIRLFADFQSLWPAVAARAQALARGGRAVLVGTDSVADSKALSACMSRAGIAHALLNANHDAAEAAVVARAGQRGAITVATNMAGRGTDIGLGEGVEALGGLHVICCQLNAARRVDRQLAGRCARQGDRGSVESWLALEAPLLRRGLPAWLRRLLRPRAQAVPNAVARALVGFVQRREENRHAEQRARMLAQDQAFDRRLSMGAPS